MVFNLNEEIEKLKLDPLLKKVFKENYIQNIEIKTSKELDEQLKNFLKIKVRF